MSGTDIFALERGEVISVIGFFFTLVGLIGTYFYIHLGNWYNDVLNLYSNYDRNEAEANAPQREAIRLCKYEYKKLFTFVPYLTAIIISIFITVVSTLSFILLFEHLPCDVLTLFLRIALIVFLFIYIGLTLFFLCSGRYYKNKMSEKLEFKSGT